MNAHSAWGFLRICSGCRVSGEEQVLESDITMEAELS